MRTTVLAAAFLAAAAGLATASPASAQETTPCPTPRDDYSCPTTGVLPVVETAPTSTQTETPPAVSGTGAGASGAGAGAGVAGATGDLPFTGGEVALLSLLGAGALAGGTVLVVAGRRRPETAA